MPQEHFGHFMARPHHKWRSDGTIWTNGTTRHSDNQRKTICWSHSATPNNQTSQSGLRMDTRRWQEEGRTTKEDMARHTERRSGDTGYWLEWCERYCQRSCQMETTRRPMFCSEREELSLSLSLSTYLLKYREREWVWCRYLKFDPFMSSSRLKLYLGRHRSTDKSRLHCQSILITITPPWLTTHNIT